MTSNAKQVIKSYGLESPVIEKIVAELAKLPTIETAILYGSRAKGNYRSGSDIDLTLTGENLTAKALYRLDNALEELLLPYTIDLSLLKEIDNPRLLEHIKRVGIIFYKKNLNKLEK